MTLELGLKLLTSRSQRGNVDLSLNKFIRAYSLARSCSLWWRLDCANHTTPEHRRRRWKIIDGNFHGIRCAGWFVCHTVSDARMREKCMLCTTCMHHTRCSVWKCCLNSSSAVRQNSNVPNQDLERWGLCMHLLALWILPANYGGGILSEAY